MKQAARKRAPAIHPNFRAWPVILLTGDFLPCPQYWEERMIWASHSAIVICCTRKKIWLTIAAPESAVWEYMPIMMLSAMLTL